MARKWFTFLITVERFLKQFRCRLSGSDKQKKLRVPLRLQSHFYRLKKYITIKNNQLTYII